ncbi:hypothetical protein [Pyrobaculum sp.]
MVTLFVVASFSTGFAFLDEEIYIKAGWSRWLGCRPRFPQIQSIHLSQNI